MNEEFFIHLFYCLFYFVVADIQEMMKSEVGPYEVQRHLQVGICLKPEARDMPDEIVHVVLLQYV
jgi:hypothetical protein